MTSRRRLVGDVEGEIQDTHGLREHRDSHHITYDKFQKDMQKYTDIEKDIISELTNAMRNNLAQTTFNQLVLNFRGKDSLIRKSMAEVNKQIKKLEGEISDATQSPIKSYETELKKLEVSKLETFKWLLLEELKNEIFHKEEALKKFMAECGTNGLEAETPDT